MRPEARVSRPQFPSGFHFGQNPMLFFVGGGGGVRCFGNCVRNKMPWRALDLEEGRTPMAEELNPLLGLIHIHVVESCYFLPPCIRVSPCALVCHPALSECSTLNRRSCDHCSWPWDVLGQIGWVLRGGLGVESKKKQNNSSDCSRKFRTADLTICNPLIRLFAVPGALTFLNFRAMRIDDDIDGFQPNRVPSSIWRRLG